VFQYVEEINRSENLNARYTWDRDEVVIQAGPQGVS
jgi:hypothetical protein